MTGGVSREIKALYTDSYADSNARAWRDLGAVEKVDNIARVWRKASPGGPAGTRKPSVVEIGSGEGAIADALARRAFFADYRGFDISTSGVEEARKRGVAGATFTAFDGDAVPVPDRDADLVVMSHVVEHLEHPRVMLYEAARIAPWVVVEVPLELHARAPKDYAVDALGHINKYNATAIRHLVQSCGFTVVDTLTTCTGLAVAEFHGKSARTRVAWEIKSKALRIAPPVARGLFTYHETLLLASPPLER